MASRTIAFASATILAVVALQPRLLGILTLMPKPVMAAAMLFTAAFVMINGLQIITTRVLDGRRTLVIGMGLTTFFGVTVYPSAFSGAPHWAEPIITTPLVLATLVALGLNLVFRIGIRKRVTMTVDSAAPALRDVTVFIERSAGIWGARRDVANRVEFAVQQTLEATIAYCGAKGSIGIELSFDEFVINADITYDGKPMEFPADPPSREELLDSEESYPRLAGFLVRHYSDRRISIKGGVRLQFDHWGSCWNEALRVGHASHQRIKLARNPCTRQTRAPDRPVHPTETCRNQHQALAGEVVHDRQDAEAPAVGALR